MLQSRSACRGRVHAVGCKKMLRADPPQSRKGAWHVFGYRGRNSSTMRFGSILFHSGKPLSFTLANLHSSPHLSEELYSAPFYPTALTRSRQQKDALVLALSHKRQPRTHRLQIGPSSSYIRPKCSTAMFPPIPSTSYGVQRAIAELTASMTLHLGNLNLL